MNYLRSRTKNIVAQESNKETLIYDTESNKAFCLNDTSATIWKMCDGKTSVGKIAGKLSEKLDTPIKEEFIWLAIDQLKKENLLINSEEVKVDFKGLSRRQVIRKVGFASVIALPIVSSLVAPTAAEAQSCIPAGNPAGSIACPSGPTPCDCSANSGFCCPGATAFPTGVCNPSGPTSQQCACQCQIP